MANSNDPQFHPCLGKLDFDSEWDEYTGKWEFEGTAFSIHIQHAKKGSVDKAIDRAIRFSQQMRLELESIRWFLAGRFLDLAHDWMEEPEHLRVEDFLSRVKLVRLTFSADGSVIFVFSDDDLFAGHWLVGTLTPDNVFGKAALEG